MADTSVIRLFPAAGAEPESVADHLRAVEAILFAAAEPVSAEDLRQRVPQGADIEALLRDLERSYAGRGVVLTAVAGKWAFRTAPDLAHLMTRERVEQRRLSRAALETLAVVAYHQPVTRAEIEEIRGVSMGSGTLDVLLETGWVKIRGRRRTPGRPVTYGTSEAFLDHFGLAAIGDLPGIEELAAAGLVAAGRVLAAADETNGEADSIEADEDRLDLDYESAQTEGDDPV